MTETLVPQVETAPEKRLFIKTYGCQMNVYDSERMADVLRPLGYAVTDDVKAADFVILNTCHIREKAAEKIYSELGKLREMRDIRRETGGDLTIAVAGCVAQAEGEEIMRRQPAVDIVVGPQAYHQLPELLTRTARARGERIGADFAPDDKFDALPAARFTEGATAFLTVQEGCDKFCTFCVVPYTRGAEWSRPMAAVLEEARQLADRGVREVTLLGQNVNAYDGERPDGRKATLAELAYALAEIPGLDRIRYTTSHPNDMADELIAAHGDLEALMPYLHLPVQAGSDRILRAMNRKHGRQKYFDLIDRIRVARPDIAIAGDFIVGFPGETDREFEDTLDLVRRVNYAGAFAFAYSPRPGTPAAGMGKQVEPNVVKDRLHRLIALLTEQQTAFNAAQAGRTLNVLFDKTGRHGHRRQAIGRSPYLQSVHVDNADHLIGQIVPVEIIAGQQNSLSGRLIADGTAGSRGLSASPSRKGRLMARESEFVPLNDDELRAVIGPNSRHVALIEDAFKVLVEAPGGGVSVNGGARDRTDARQVIEDLAKRAALGAEVTEADVRAALGQARGGRGTPGMAAAGVSLPGSKRGAIVPKTKAQAAYLDMLGRCELSFGVGPAGTGKTFLAAAYGASLLRRGQVDRLVITRPAVEAGEKLGFLPGDLNEKVDPYLAPIWEALNDILGAEDVQRRRDKGEIEAAPIAFMRGRTLSHAFVIVDEAQNTSRLQMKMVLTRLGEGARMVVTGDPSQIDLLNPRDSGLAHALRILDGVQGVGILKFEASDVVRHAMVERIVRAYDADAARGRPAPDLEDPA